MQKRAERRYRAEKVATRRYVYFAGSDARLGPVPAHCPRGKYRKWNGSCACPICEWEKIYDIRLQRMKDERRNLLAE